MAYMPEQRSYSVADMEEAFKAGKSAESHSVGYEDVDKPYIYNTVEYSFSSWLEDYLTKPNTPVQN